MLTIGEFAQATGLTAKALRLYDDLGLLCPAEVSAHNGYRYYERTQVDAARLVARLRLAGVPLAQIAAIAGADTPQAAAAMLLSYWRGPAVFSWSRCGAREGRCHATPRRAGRYGS